jgi:cyclic pyranopterin phosphate synthase
MGITMVLRDSYGRPLLNLRIAVTNRCNLTCSYCHREGEERLDNDASDEMGISEIVRIADVAVKSGLSRIKLTGGEPLVRKDIIEIVAGISRLRGLADFSITTNGTLLAPMAEKLHIKCLNRVNVSLPTLDAKMYHELTGGRVENVLEGVKTAIDVGFSPVKLNMLILRGINDFAVSEMIKFAEEMGAILQLIELEPIGLTNEYYSERHKSLDEYELMLKQEATRIETRQHMQNRRVYHLPQVKVEVIRPIENTEFCLHCTRLRVTSDGRLKPCLMRSDNTVDILTPMRHGAGKRDLAELFKLANSKRLPYNR